MRQPPPRSSVPHPSRTDRAVGPSPTKLFRLEATRGQPSPTRGYLAAILEIVMDDRQAALPFQSPRSRKLRATVFLAKIRHSHGFHVTESLRGGSLVQQSDPVRLSTLYAVLEWRRRSPRLSRRRHESPTDTWRLMSGIRQRLPNFFRGRGDKGDIDEIRLTQSDVTPTLVSCRSTLAGVSVRISRSSARRSRGSAPD